MQPARGQRLWACLRGLAECRVRKSDFHAALGQCSCLLAQHNFSPLAPWQTMLASFFNRPHEWISQEPLEQHERYDEYEQ